MNWSHIYKSEVSPVLENFASGPPLWVYGIIGVLVLAATALIVWAPMKFKLGGIVLLFFCGFLGFMVLDVSARHGHRRLAISSSVDWHLGQHGRNHSCRFAPR